MRQILTGWLSCAKRGQGVKHEVFGEAPIESGGSERGSVPLQPRLYQRNIRSVDLLLTITAGEED
jgi:hypothetical protein